MTSLIDIQTNLADDFNTKQHRMKQERKDAKEFYNTYAETFTSVIKKLDTVIDLNRITISVAHDSFDLHFSGSREELLAICKVLYSSGLRPCYKASPGDTSWATYWELDEGGTRLLWFSFTSTTCVRRQIGTETIERPVYEIDCGPLGDLSTIADGETA